VLLDIANGDFKIIAKHDVLQDNFRDLFITIMPERKMPLLGDIAEFENKNGRF
jgi:hypothetical protein